MNFKSRVRKLARRAVGYNFGPLVSLSEAVAEGHASIGRHSYGEPAIWRWLKPDGTWNGGDVHIGSFCSISAQVTILTGGEHNSRWATTFPLRIHYDLPGAHLDGQPRTNGDVIIGNDVWLGAGCWIMSGVKIGDGAIVGAGAVVSADVRPYAIVTGNRAVETGRRFDDGTIDRLVDLRWWDWPDDQIRSRVDELSARPSRNLYEDETPTGSLP